MELDTKTNQELVRYVIVLLLAPVWVPFAKALFTQLLRAVKPDGGLYGRTPNPRKRAVIERELAREEDPLVHEPIAHSRGARGTRGAIRRKPGRTAGKPGLAGRGAKPAPPAPSPRRGFR